MTETMHVVLIKPTHYDDDGYPMRWWRSNIPANTLACLYALADGSRERRILGDVPIRITPIDETNARVDHRRLLRMIRRDGGKALVAFVGVQSNQYPRACDLARPFLDAGVPVCFGGFHVAGSLSMLDGEPPEIAAAREAGISFFLGEAEGPPLLEGLAAGEPQPHEPGANRLDPVIRDAYAGRLKPRYDYRNALPGLEGATVPHLPREQVERTYGTYSSFDLGRGCPFQCSFCTIINVQGRISRYRAADDLEAIVRENAAIGVNRFFLTDDNLARNRNWEKCFDRLIELREREGLAVRLMVQVDTLCHRIPNFIDKAVGAGVDLVFVGMENINPDNLLAAKKAQNRLGEYREMLLAWKQHPVIIMAGYILGFPNDTRASIMRDVETVKRELPIDMIYFTQLTPLPGCEDHQKLAREGAWMDPDLNKYDLNHRVTHHPTMSDEEWDGAYRDAWNAFYTWEHMETIIRRMAALGSNKKYATIARLVWYRDFPRLYGCHPLEGGFVNLKRRRERRPGMKLENPFTFYPRYIGGEFIRLARMTRTYLRLRSMMHAILRDEKRFEYTDSAITLPGEGEDDALISTTRGGTEAVAKERKRHALVDKIKREAREKAPGPAAPAVEDAAAARRDEAA